jgi:hypothetical protein
MKIKIENLKFQCHLQGKARVNPAPATLAVNGHGFFCEIFMMEFTPQYITTNTCMPPSPLTHQATS